MPGFCILWHSQPQVVPTAPCAALRVLRRVWVITHSKEVTIISAGNWGEHLQSVFWMLQYCMLTAAVCSLTTSGRQYTPVHPPPLNITELSLRPNESAQGDVETWLAKAPNLQQLQWDCAPRGGHARINQPLGALTFQGCAPQQKGKWHAPQCHCAA